MQNVLYWLRIEIVYLANSLRMTTLRWEAAVRAGC
jgi:hypothetical protein